MAGALEILRSVEGLYRRHFGGEPARASVSFVGVEPIEVLRFADGDLTHYATLGMSRHPMIDPGEATTDQVLGPRAELLLSLRHQPDEVWRKLAVLAASPAVEGTVYAPGNRIDLGESLVDRSRCVGVIVAASSLGEIEISDGDPVRIFRLLPATTNELAWARVHGSDALIDRWRGRGVDLEDLMRTEVALD